MTLAAVSSATAVAHANIALAKYWGKVPGDGNYPAVPSLSVTLDSLRTTTTVSFDAALGLDEFELDGAPVPWEGADRVRAMLDRVRAAGSERRRARVVSRNDFPTASGLASSASGFAALAVASAAAAGLSLDASALSDLARQSSASAARSLFGGFVTLAAGTRDGVRDLRPLSAEPVGNAATVPMRILVCVNAEDKKAVSSRRGMGETCENSPFYSAWVDFALRNHGAQLRALVQGDFDRLGTLAEGSALAMHASAIAAGVVYWNAATLSVMEAVRRLREGGTRVFMTMDAGPHVKAIVVESDAPFVEAQLARVVGVTRVLSAKPGPGAHLIAHAP